MNVLPGKSIGVSDINSSEPPSRTSSPQPSTSTQPSSSAAHHPIRKLVTSLSDSESEPEELIQYNDSDKRFRGISYDPENSSADESLIVTRQHTTNLRTDDFVLVL
jgi:hypothetical protein